MCGWACCRRTARTTSGGACARTARSSTSRSWSAGYPRLFGKGKALKRILRAERLTRADVLYIGDELRDVEAAKKAGVKVAAVAWGFHTAELLRSGSPDYVVRDVSELMGVVDQNERAV